MEWTDVVEHAIREKLHTFGPGLSPIGDPMVWLPVSVDSEAGTVAVASQGGGITHRDTWDRATWEAVAGLNGEWLKRKVGFWSFVNAGDDAADEIRFAHDSPHSAGRTIKHLRDELAASHARIAALEAAI